MGGSQDAGSHVDRRAVAWGRGGSKCDKGPRANPKARPPAPARTAPTVRGRALKDTGSGHPRQALLPFPGRPSWSPWPLFDHTTRFCLRASRAALSLETPGSPHQPCCTSARSSQQPHWLGLSPRTCPPPRARRQGPSRTHLQDRKPKVALAAGTPADHRPAG